MRFFLGHLEDNFILLPTLVLSLGRHPFANTLGGFSLSISFLNIEAGLEIDFFA